MGADVLIVNKFGKHEAEGRGFRMVVAEALKFFGRNVNRRIPNVFCL